MIDIEWSGPAFSQLEELPEFVAFEIISRVDLLASFPEMGVSLHSQYPALLNCRQLIVRRTYRVVYEFNSRKGFVYILAVQHCRRMLPTISELRRAKNE
jgi:plasmid stabilization system protein ParE